jgi:cysteine-S-conjugate beta-lyase
VLAAAGQGKCQYGKAISSLHLNYAFIMDLNVEIDRNNTGSKKWDKYRGKDIIPLWLADMDFPSPDSVLKALHDRVEHGIMGYTSTPQALVELVLAHLHNAYQWQIKAEWLVWLPGVVAGLNLACRAVGECGDGVLVSSPVYPPFLRAPGLAKREEFIIPMRTDGQNWHLDWDALQQAVTVKTKLLMLCHPHNPLGKVWSLQELRELREFAQKNQLVVCSDEIHCDLLLDVHAVHTPFAAIAPEFQDSTITLMAPTKTWNLPGLACAFAVIPNPTLRARFQTEMAGLVPSATIFAYVAAQAAYSDDGAWRAQLIEILRENRQLLVDFFHDSNLKLTIPHATYLAWIDASSVDTQNPLPIFEAHGVGLSDGREFGFPGWLRINFGCSTATLREALRRMQPLRKLRNARPAA